MTDLLAEEVARYERLVVVAAPRTLGDLRERLDPRVAARIHDEVDKDLTREALPQLEQHLADRLWPAT